MIHDTIMSRIVRTLPKGCRLCHKGATMVLFLTGLCRRTCWYCPLSAERKGRDVAFVNERMVDNDTVILSEARRMGALGTAITGGEPFMRPERLSRACRALKDELGDDHHIHLYTGIAPNRENLEPLTGLVEEIRMHPPDEQWADILQSSFIESIRMAKELGFSSGFEVPSLPGVDNLGKALPELDFLNINELEWGGMNADDMRLRGLEPGVTDNGIRGARAWASSLIGRPGVHWCPSRFKDTVQLRKRLLRIAQRTSRAFDTITPDGTVVYGVIEPDGGDHLLIRTLDPELFEVRGNRIETGIDVINKYTSQLRGRRCIVERYPDRGIIVEVTPL
jgi:pyruvate formate-lyase activating enzyme-like uncharacterized protein